MELQHHGVLGMRWGVRRFRQKAKIGDYQGMLGNAKTINDGAAKTVKRRGIKKYAIDAKGMSDDELRTVNNRMNMEKQFVQLSSEQINTGRATVKDVIEGVGTAISMTTAALTLYSTIKKLGTAPAS